MTDVVKVAVEAARAAGKIQRERAGDIQNISEKGGLRGDVVTEVDLLCEKEIISRIKSAFPDHAILAEESGDTQGDVNNKWIIDPLDGSLNYSHGYPCYCVSIGLEHNGEQNIGVIYNPNLDELFVAEKGRGATLNGKPIKNARGFAHIVRKISSGGVMRLQISRQGGRLFLALKKP